MQIKQHLGKLTLTGPLAAKIASQQANGIHLLAVELAHVLALESLPNVHKDPFDRLLVAQANSEGAVLLTRIRSLQSIPCKSCGSRCTVWLVEILLPTRHPGLRTSIAPRRYPHQPAAASASPAATSRRRSASTTACGAPPRTSGPPASTGRCTATALVLRAAGRADRADTQVVVALDHCLLWGRRDGRICCSARRRGHGLRREQIARYASRTPTAPA